MPKKAATPKVPSPPKVWIELEKPINTAHAERLCELANTMLKRLSEPDERSERGFFWSEHENRYCFGGGMGYMVLKDNGEWFNLEYFGRPLEETELKVEEAQG